jgi:hypothetical protein
VKTTPIGNGRNPPNAGVRALGPKGRLWRQIRPLDRVAVAAKIACGFRRPTPNFRTPALAPGIFPE